MDPRLILAEYCPLRGARMPVGIGILAADDGHCYGTDIGSVAGDLNVRVAFKIQVERERVAIVVVVIDDKDTRQGRLFAWDGIRCHRSRAVAVNARISR